MINNDFDPVLQAELERDIEETREPLPELDGCDEAKARQEGELAERHRRAIRRRAIEAHQEYLLTHGINRRPLV